MGGRGSSGGKRTGGGGGNVVTQESVQKEVEAFTSELENRQYGTGKGLVPENQQQEYRRLKREVTRFRADENLDSDERVVFSSGFANSDNYVHTTAKLNNYQKLVRRDTKDVLTDVKLGVISPSKAKSELNVLKDLDATISRRRKLLKG